MVNDFKQLPPMLEQLDDRYERVPNEALVDGGFVTKDAIDHAADHDCTVYAPVNDETKQKAEGKDPYARKKRDSDATAAWRQRMGTEEAKEIYRLRAQTAEWVNAQCRNRGIWVAARANWCRKYCTLLAITHNLIVAARLRTAAG